MSYSLDEYRRCLACRQAGPLKLVKLLWYGRTALTRAIYHHRNEEGPLFMHIAGTFDR
jgi:hypothetical protein